MQCYSRPSYRFFPRLFTFNRSFATSVDPGDVKPKSKTTLRRTAADSLPIRSNPTPTRSEIQTVFTLTTAQRYLLSRLVGHPNAPAHSQILHEALWVPKWRGKNSKEGEIFVFGNGSFVCWGLGEADARLFADKFLEKVQDLQVAPLKVAETEELEFVMDPSEETRLQGDLIILGKTPASSTKADVPPNAMALPSETLLSRYAYSQALSRSTALSALEVSLNDYLSSMSSLPHALEKTGKPGMGRKQLVMKLGQLIKFRQGLNLTKENFSDVPDFYWEEPELEKQFMAMSNALEVRERTDKVNEKIDYATEVQSTLRQLLTESSSHRMELVIIALIAVEVVIALIRDGPELWHMMKGEEPKTQTQA